MNLIVPKPARLISAWEEFRRSGEWCATGIKPYAPRDVVLEIAASIERSGLILVSLERRG